jgi:L,D-peptidoglycan transpeptidase YkuD (ErfK/YbiS/YcfS/YnhG family)
MYDVIIVMDHNYTSRIRNRGSDVFMHLDAGKPYTAGCIAIELKIMKQLLPMLGSQTKIEIFP